MALNSTKVWFRQVQMARKGGLGRGLDALIPGGDFENSTPQGGALLVQSALIAPNPRQPRDHMDGDDLEDLANSIREHGILQPLIVTFDPLTGMYTLIAGERRLRASKIAGLEEVPVIVRDADDLQRLELALIENVQRADLSPLETAEAYRELADEFSLSHEEISARVAKSRVSVTNTLRLLKLPDIVQKALADRQISEGHARALLGLTTPQSQIAALQSILAHELNVRQTEELVRKLTGHKPEPVSEKIVDPEIQELEQRLRDHLSTRVSLHHGKKGGTITIHYFSDEELDGLIHHLLGD
jgi:ParB family transcriptional regulator, chromosome partitioning protein